MDYNNLLGDELFAKLPIGPQLSARARFTGVVEKTA